MSLITTHVLDTARGRPAAGMLISLAQHQSDDSWITLAEGKTNEDGRIRDLLPANRLEIGIYRLIFATGEWFHTQGQACFYPVVEVCFLIEAPHQHYHVPLLLSPFGYSTYRGS